MRDKECYGGNFVVTITARGPTAATRPSRHMHEVTEATLLKRARGAAAGGDWQTHTSCSFRRTRRPRSPDPTSPFSLGAYAAGHVDATIEAWERVHAEGLRAGDHLMAAGAAVRVALHLLFDTALLAPIRGWASGRSDSSRGRTTRRFMRGSRWCGATNGCCPATSERPAVGPSSHRGRAPAAIRRPRPSAGSRRRAA